MPKAKEPAVDSFDGSLPHLIDIRGLKPYEANSRTHSEEQIEQLMESFRRFGFTGVLGYDAKGLMLGHGRQIAAERMWTAGETLWGPGKRQALPEWHLPAIDTTGLSDAERRALIIADNKLALNAGWDDDKLRAEMEALAELDFDLPVMGFDHKELDRLLKPAVDERDPDEVPPIEEAVGQEGDLWLLGDHRLLCGDSARPEDVEKLIGGQGAVLTLTDPPYGIGYEYREHDDSSNDANAELVARVFALAPDAKVWTPGPSNLFRDGSRFGNPRLVIWYKKFAQAGSGLGGAATFEPILVLNPPSKRLDNDVLEIGTDREALDGVMLREYHPCPKPVELYERLAEAFSDRGAVIYEPFCGSGTTLVACERTGRRCCAMEIDPVYVDVTIRRWQQHTGQQARRADGALFDDLRGQALKAA